MTSAAKIICRITPTSRLSAMFRAAQTAKSRASLIHGRRRKNVQRSALISYTNASTEDIDRILSDGAVADKITYSLVHSSRPRALEAADFTLRFNDVSLSGITHFTRHRMQSIEIPELIRADRKRHIVPESVKKTLSCFLNTKPHSRKTPPNMRDFAHSARVRKASCTTFSAATRSI